MLHYLHCNVSAVGTKYLLATTVIDTSYYAGFSLAWHNDPKIMLVGIYVRLIARGM